MSVRRLWLAVWLAWLLCSAAQPVPPWSATALLAQEESLARHFAESTDTSPVWSIDIGGTRQGRALRDGWARPETFAAGAETKSFAWVEGASAAATFAGSGWERAVLSLEAAPLESLAPLDVRVEVDGVARGNVTLKAGWARTEAIVGRIEPGRHELRLVPARRTGRRSFAVAGLALSDGPVADPDRDRGVFTGVRRIGLDERPVLFVSSEAELREDPTATVLAADRGLMSWCGLAAPAVSGPAVVAMQIASGLLAAALLALLTGLVWVRSGTPMAQLAQAVGFSALSLAAAFALLRVAGVPPAPLHLAAVLFGLGLAARLRPGTPPPLAVAPHLLLLAAAGLAALVLFATYVVPPLEEQDMEVQGTAHALATRLVPASLTRRGAAYDFAHPPLLRLFEAGAFALSGRLERVAYYDEAAQAAAARPLVEPASDADEHARIDAWRDLLARFRAEPHLWLTRQVNVVLGAVATALLAGLAARASGSAGLGTLLGLYWITLPETLVRGACGGSFSIAVLLSLLVLAALAEGATPRGLAGVSALAALSEPKALLVPIGWLIGAGAALAASATYGLAAAGREFVFESRSYASPAGLWSEMTAHYGAWLIAAGAVAVLAALRSAEAEVRAAAWATLIGAIAFTAIDGRQTRHLALLVPPALLCVAAGVPHTKAGRAIAGGALLLATAWNVSQAAALIVHFDAIRPTPSW